MTPDDYYDPSTDKGRNKSRLGAVYSALEDGEPKTIDEVYTGARARAHPGVAFFGGDASILEAMKLLRQKKHGKHVIRIEKEEGKETRYRLELKTTRRVYVDHGKYIMLYTIKRGRYLFERMEYGDGAEKRAKDWVQEEEG